MSDSEITTLEDAAPVAVAAPKQGRGAKKEGAAAATIKGENHDARLSGKTVILTIHVSGEDGGADAVNISLNGYAYQIPRNTPCRVPAEVARVIENAVIEEYKPIKGNEVQRIDRPRFAYTISE